MNVLIVTQYFWPESFRINDIVSSLTQKGLSIDVLTAKPNYPSGRIYNGYQCLGVNNEKYKDASIFRVPIIPRGSKNIFLLFLNYISFIFFASIISPFKYINKNFDIIFVYGLSPILQSIPAIFLGWIKNAPVIIYVQDLWPDSLSATGYIKNKFILNFVGYLVRFIYSRADLLLVQSNAFIAPILKISNKSSVIYLPNSVDNSFYDFNDITLPYIASLDNGFSVLFAGNVGTAQAVNVIVDAAIALKDNADIRFVVLGNGSRLEWMRQQIKYHGLNNIFLEGHYSVELMPGLMRKASALLVSLSDQPIFAATIPNKIQAYLAVGRPILACLNGEGARIIDEANAGISIPAEDSMGLVSAILHLYNLPVADRDVMGQNGRLYFKHNFDHDKLIDDLIFHFEKLSCKDRQFK